ncbi:MAG: hypothetical protein QF886_01740 [Planctomycetota bacterium]|jgi:hypothetical protein|nr:hypothetical protein [Planctomycetota bacterium]
MNVKGSGGTEGGCGLFVVGFILAAAGAYLFVDSVRVMTGHLGVFGGMMRRSGMGGTTTSMGLIFVPFFIGIVLLFYNADWKVGWGLAGLGLVIIIVEILSGIRFYMNIKVSHMILLLIMMAGGCGMMIRSFKDGQKAGAHVGPAP